MHSIVLIGMMGSGKTTISRDLAGRSSFSFIDIDSRLEQQEGLKISEIFSQFGEHYFRQLESRFLHSLVGTKNSVISTGGGIVLLEENRSVLKSLGRVYFLRATETTLYARLKHDTSRPLLHEKDPLSSIQHLISQRYPLYESVSDVIMDVDTLSPFEVSTQIWAEFLAHK